MAYTCPECGEELDDFQELQRHTMEVHAPDSALGAEEPPETSAAAGQQRPRAMVPLAIAVAILIAAGALALIALGGGAER